MYSKSFLEIDAQYQDKLEQERIFEVTNQKGDKPTYYILDMFAYPSGVGLHLGHALTYTATDIRARTMRLLGYEVLYPVGFDSFGLPTENFAIKMGKSAQRVTIENTDNFREQLKRLAISYDWNREIITSDKEYYKWTQWIILKLWENGLLYKKLAPVNWCPNCQTVLANEQVVHGKCERDETMVEQRQMSQWFVNITKYADELVDGLDDLDWPEESKKLQKNWIGRKEGYEFTISTDDGLSVQVFVENNDFNTDIAGVAISLDHPIVGGLITSNNQLGKELDAYSKEINTLGSIDRYERYTERTGIFSGIYLSSPFNKKNIPLFISGNTNTNTDAEILYPSSQNRDKALFMAKNISFTEINTKNIQGEEPYKLQNLGIIHSAKRYRLRDWSISRQRFWGAPMPFIQDLNGEIHGVDENELPILLPDDIANYKPSGISPLEQVPEFINTHTKNGKLAKREADTLDTFVDSSFYYLRYLNPSESNEFIIPEALEKWGDVDMYIGGKEHVTAHLIYARFIHKFLNEIGIVKSSEPFHSLRHQGIVLDSSGVKMSKRLGNVVNPIDVINKYGADTLRMYLMFMGPLSDPHMWDENGIEGVSRFFDKVEKIGTTIDDTYNSKEEDILIRQLIGNIKKDTLALKYNTAVSKFMIFANKILDTGKISKNTFKLFLILLNPYAPNITNHLWKNNGFNGNIDNEQFPTIQENSNVVKSANIVIQINGKMRGLIENISLSLSQDEVLELAKMNIEVAKYLEGRIIKNIVYRVGKIINIVI